ncbi:acyl-CoA dehydrogenase family protein [Sphingomonas sp. OK281]|uniref:acyl-CoA dehydrogenase family protein n=1 Tax=Sphingomonas sp. OK281 TaxID=1881067 RepID=UPI0008EE97A2|nr:acyl-CoA dehydrogenase family protein [Sphingomonas sp. OK281]SFO35634.1 Acyl-CoA dehydrogenase [Sphingomonas sp. OK281]
MTDALEILRHDVRAWLAAEAPKDWRATCTTHEGFLATQRDWFAKLAAGGYAVPHWSAEWPGGGRSLAEQKVIYEELARADTPRLLLSFMSTYHAASTLFEWGSAEQQARYIQRILEGEIWCQGFSEPNAGSDLAGVRTRAERVTRDGRDVYVVNGQKLWSTMGQFADQCLLLVRTSSEGAKQAGLTYLLLDLKTKGVTARPIHQIHGDEEFAELFLDEVEVPVADRLGEEGQGWAVAQSTLSSERGLTLLELSARMRGALWRIADLIRGGGREGDAGIVRDFGRLATKIDATCALADQFLANRIAGEERVGDASLVKLSYSRTLRDFTSLGLRIGGLQAQYHEPIVFGGGMETGNWMADFMNSYAWTIAGGSDEVQRNIIAERLLGMPREPKSWTLETVR